MQTTVQNKFLARQLFFYGRVAQLNKYTIALFPIFYNGDNIFIVTHGINGS